MTAHPTEQPANDELSNFERDILDLESRWATRERPHVKGQFRVALIGPVLCDCDIGRQSEGMRAKMPTANDRRIRVQAARLS